MLTGVLAGVGRAGEAILDTLAPRGSNAGAGAGVGVVGAGAPRGSRVGGGAAAGDTAYQSVNTCINMYV